MSTNLQVRPDSVLPGDRLTPRGGALAGSPVEVVDVLKGRFGTYTLVVRPLGTMRISVGYSEMLLVERPERQGE